MKPELQRVAIPKGWRKLRVGETVHAGDLIVFGSGTKVRINYTDGAARQMENGLCYIRRTARPRKIVA